MYIPCEFQKIQNGYWKCFKCGYIHAKPSRRAPVRVCKDPSRKVTYAPTSQQLGERPPGKPPRARSKASITSAKASRAAKRVKTKGKQPVASKPLLGDHVKNFLTAVGVTPERVSQWLGKPCGCTRRQEKLNEIHQAWKAWKDGSLKDPEAKNHVEQMTDE